jgi:hypothetical protein
MESSQLFLDRLVEASKELSDLLKVKVFIRIVTGTDHFYTDGATVGATFMITLPDNLMNYLQSDGSEQFIMSGMWAEYGPRIIEFIRQKTA